MIKILKCEKKNYQFELNKLFFKRQSRLKINKNVKNAFICFGQIQNRTNRQKVFEELKKLNYKFPIIKSHTAYISQSSKILDGSINTPKNGMTAPILITSKIDVNIINISNIRNW